MRRLPKLLCASLCLAPLPATAQQNATANALASWIALDSPPGDERDALSIIRRDQRWEEDAQGNLIKRVGTGRPRRVIACGIDRVGYVVSGITDAGYLRVHRVGGGALHPLWDQFHEAQQILVRTANGEVPGVVAVPNGHFARQHRGDTAVVNVDQLYIDVGASSRSQVAALGIRLIDPVRRDVPPWTFGTFVAGMDASGRAGCAALDAVSRAPAGTGETIYIISNRRATGWHGLTSALARIADVDRIALVGSAPLRASDSDAVRRATGPLAVLTPIRGRPDTVMTLSVRTRWAGSHVETVSAPDADALRAAVAVFAGVDVAEAQWRELSHPAPAATPRRDAFSNLAETLRKMADLPGVPGHEFRVREAVRAALPAWARERAVVDSLGNIYFSVGPARDTVVVVAHMDEVSFTVAGIQRDGTVQLTARGGVIPSAWEGQPGLLHLEKEGDVEAVAALRGIFVPRDTASLRAPRGNTAWFGLDSAALVARGVRVGQGVTAYKRAQRLAGTRFTGRAMDDRAGTTALIAAANALDTSRLDHTIIFAWSVAEEGGLVGAVGMARTFGPTVRRVYAVDTFVSSDTPLEQPTFAYVPLGNGPVLRALDDGIISSRAERDRVIGLARNARIPLQVGTTHGSTDATAFARWGAPGAGLSWPGRYSHSPGEVLDLRDLADLARLIRVVVSAPTGGR